MGAFEKQNYKNIIPFHGVRKVLGNEIPTYVYWVDGLLVDTGPRKLGDYYRPAISEKKVERVVITHHHEDHTGNAAYFAEKGIPVYIHHSSADLAKREAKIPFYRWLFWGQREAFPAIPLGESLETSKGEVLKVIETPGHTNDHVTFFLPSEGAIFTGDLFVNSKTKVGMPGEDYWKWMKSLDMLLKLDFDTIYCSHSGIIKDGKMQMAAKAELLKELQERVSELRQKGMGLKEINKNIFPKTAPIKYFSGGEWDSIHIIHSLMMGE